MNKETAEKYVLYGIKSTRFTKKMCWAFLPFNICLSAIALVMFHQIVFIILVIVGIITNFIISLVTNLKWSVITGFLSQAMQLIYFIFTLDILYFSMYKLSELFVWYEFLISILTQFLSLALSVPIVIKSANKYDKDRHYRNTISGSVAAFFCMSVTIFSKIFLTDVSLSVILTILSILFNLIIYIVNYVVVMAFYRTYLIKKFDLKIQLE